MKCDNCLNSRSVISESGLHHVCSLSEKKSVDCMLDKKNYNVTLHITKISKHQSDFSDLIEEANDE